MPEPITAHLEIEGMHCGGCVTRVTGALRRIPGVEVTGVEVGSAEILSSSPIPRGILADAIRNAGLTLKTVAVYGHQN